MLDDDKLNLIAQVAVPVPDWAQDAKAILHRANMVALHTRYGDPSAMYHAPLPFAVQTGHTWAQVADVIAEYEYQARQQPDWGASDAQFIVSQARAWCVANR